MFGLSPFFPRGFFFLCGSFSYRLYCDNTSVLARFPVQF